MTILTRGEIADLRERSKVVNVRFSANIVADLVETIDDLAKALDYERIHGAAVRAVAQNKGDI
jgi:hypothetical protein